MEITIPTAEDARAIAELNVLAWQRAYQGLMPDEFLANLSVEKREVGWRRWIIDSNCSTHVARDPAATIRGYVAYAKSRDPDETESTAEIVAIYVDPACWGCGIGTQLLGRALKEIAGLRYSKTSLWVLQRNSRARQFYSKHGFRTDDGPARLIDIGGTELEELRYVIRHGA